MGVSFIVLIFVIKCLKSSKVSRLELKLLQKPFVRSPLFICPTHYNVDDAVQIVSVG